MTVHHLRIIAYRRTGTDPIGGDRAKSLTAKTPVLKGILATAVLALAPLSPAGCRPHEEGRGHHELQKIVVTSPMAKDVTVTQRYVCQIHSQRNIEVRALDQGYLQEIRIKEGQAVKRGDLMFKLLPVVYQAKLDSAKADAQLAQIKVTQSEGLLKKGVVAPADLALAKAELAKAQAEVTLAEAELGFTDVKAPFDGIVDRLFEQQGSLVEEGDVLTNLSDNGVMWVYFNVPEARYLEYMTAAGQGGDRGDEGETEREVAATDLPAAVKEAVGKKCPGCRILNAGVETEGDEVEYEVEVATTDGGKAELDVSPDGKKVEPDDDSDDDEDRRIELVLADGSKFPHAGKIAAIEAEFDNETGNIPFRADFPNSEGLLRHGQTGNVLIHRTLEDAVVIPQRATFEILDKRYVYVVDGEGVVHQREIGIGHEMEDVFVVERGLDANDKIVLDGVRQVRDGEHVEFEFRKPEEALANQKYHAE